MSAARIEVETVATVQGHSCLAVPVGQRAAVAVQHLDPVPAGGQGGRQIEQRGLHTAVALQRRRMGEDPQTTGPFAAG